MSAVDAVRTQRLVELIEGPVESNLRPIRELVDGGASQGYSRLVMRTTLRCHPDDENLFRVLLAAQSLSKDIVSSFLHTIMLCEGKANLHMADILLPYDPDLDFHYSGQTMIWYRLQVEPPDLQAVRWLIDHGVKDFLWAGETITPFDLIIWNKLYAIAREIIDLGTPVDRLGGNGYPPLMNAVQSDDEKMVEILIGAKADVNQPDIRGRRALHLAASHGNTAMVSYLLKHGADPNLSTPIGFRPLNFARKDDVRCALVEAEAGARDDLEPSDCLPKSELQCIICLEEGLQGEDIHVRACHDKHILCRDCVDQWQGETCPICRENEYC